MHMIVSWGSNVNKKIAIAAQGENGTENVRRISQSCELANVIWRAWATNSSGSVISTGLGEGKVEVLAEFLGDVAGLRNQYAERIDSVVGVGVGSTVEEADKAMKCALKKEAGGVVLYADDILEESEDDSDSLGGLLERTLEKAAPGQYVPPATPSNWWKNPEGEVKETPWYERHDFRQGNVYTDDKVTVPAKGHPSKQNYDARFKQALEQRFAAPGKKLVPVVVDVSHATNANTVKDHPRYNMYRQMFRDGDAPQPVLVENNGDSFHILDGNHRHLAAKAEGVSQIAGYRIVDADDLAKASGWRGLAAAAGIGIAGAMAALPTTDSRPSPEPIVTAAPKGVVSGGAELELAPLNTTWTPKNLAHELHPIAHLESSFGQNLAHAAHSKGDYHTAFGAVGLKPVTAHEEYLKHSQALRQDYPGLEHPDDFVQAFKADPILYNRAASAHFARLKERAGGSLAGAAYSWRWGPTAFRKLNADPDKRVMLASADPYVKTYLTKFKELGAYKHNSPVLNKEIAKAEPALQGGAGGMTGAMRPMTPAAPAKPRVEGSEHTQGEAVRSLVENEGTSPERTHAAKDFVDLEEALHGHADQQEKEDSAQAGADQKTAEDHELRAAIVKVLEKFKGQAATLEKIKASNPQLYSTMMGVVQSMMVLARGTLGEDMRKSEAPTYSEVEPHVFEAAISRHPDQSSLDKERDYSGKRVFLAHDKLSGYTLGEDGYFGNLFSLAPGHGSFAVKDAVSKGAVKGTCFDGHLPAYYAKHGFWEVGREPNWTPGGPDVVHVQYGPLAKMALKDIGVGQKVTEPGAAALAHDYTTLLPSDVQRTGLRLLVVHDGPEMRAVAFDPAQKVPVGSVSGLACQYGRLNVGGSELAESHRGKGIGTALYEALMAHAHNVTGCNVISGDVHSSMASKVHRKLSQKHGMAYVPRPNVGRGRTYASKEDFDYTEDEPFDDKYKEYEYHLKGEEAMAKMALADIPVGNSSHDDGTDYFDYTHILPKSHYENGWSLEVSHNREDPYVVMARLYHGTAAKGFLKAYNDEDDSSIRIHHSSLEKEHLGQGFGTAMYEAVLAHSKNRLGASEAKGGFHSSMAARAHKSVSKRHGMDYFAPETGAVDVCSDDFETTPYDDAYGYYRYQLKGEEAMAKMALADIPVGREVPHEQVKGLDSTGFIVEGDLMERQVVSAHDYSHLLSDLHRQQGYRLHVIGRKSRTAPPHFPLNYAANLSQNGRLAGEVEGEVEDGRAHVGYTKLKDAHWGKKLGVTMYEAFYAHAKNALGATDAEGGIHSSMASRAHQSLSAKHGMDYRPDKVEWRQKQEEYAKDKGIDPPEPAPFDDAYAEYGYQLKGEEAMVKMALADIPVGKRLPTPKAEPFAYEIPVHHHDYNHVLTPEEIQEGYTLSVLHLRANSRWDTYRANLKHNGMSAGHVSGSLVGGAAKVTIADLREEHHGRGLGARLYETFFAHMKNHLGATYAKGSDHSSMAARAHRSLSNKHGMDYSAEANLEVPKGDEAPFDEAYGPYEYQLKGEERMVKEEVLTKGIRIPTVVKPPPTHHPINLPSGSTKSGAAADAHPSRRSGQIKVTEDGHDRWRQVRSGMVKNPQTGEAVSARTVPKREKAPDAQG